MLFKGHVQPREACLLLPFPPLKVRKRETAQGVVARLSNVALPDILRKVPQS